MEQQWNQVMFYFNSLEFMAQLVCFSKFALDVTVPIHAKLTLSSKPALFGQNTHKDGEPLPAGFNAHGMGAACRFARKKLRDVQTQPERATTRAYTSNDAHTPHTL
jgi:hypothetical protein